jgi:hypothetical protein
MHSFGRILREEIVNVLTGRSIRDFAPLSLARFSVGIHDEVKGLDRFNHLGVDLLIASTRLKRKPSSLAGRPYCDASIWILAIGEESNILDHDRDAFPAARGDVQVGELAVKRFQLSDNRHREVLRSFEQADCCIRVVW